jgi:hypothetical protein
MQSLNKHQAEKKTSMELLETILGKMSNTSKTQKNFIYFADGFAEFPRASQLHQFEPIQ